jgi:hypothetical protein
LISANVVRISLRFTLITSSTFKKGDYTRLPGGASHTLPIQRPERERLKAFDYSRRLAAS